MDTSLWDLPPQALAYTDMPCKPEQLGRCIASCAGSRTYELAARHTYSGMQNPSNVWWCGSILLIKWYGAMTTSYHLYHITSCFPASRWYHNDILSSTPSKVTHQSFRGSHLMGFAWVNHTDPKWDHMNEQSYVSDWYHHTNLVIALSSLPMSYGTLNQPSTFPFPPPILPHSLLSAIPFLIFTRAFLLLNTPLT
jgi:hypothetical protein